MIPEEGTLTIDDIRIPLECSIKYPENNVLNEHEVESLSHFNTAPLCYELAVWNFGHMTIE